MAASKKKGFVRHAAIFTRSMPGTGALFALLIIASVVVGILITLLVHAPPLTLRYILVVGLLTGIALIMLPTMLTILVMKAQAMNLRTKYLMFSPLVCAFSYSIFLLIGSAIYRFYHAPSLAIAVILVGNASIFSWWFFVNKLLFGRRRSAPILALVQPTLNVLMLAQYSMLIFNTGESLNILLIKLYLGIIVFSVVSYLILYTFDRQAKRIGIDAFEAFSQMIRNWLYDANISMPFGGKRFGVAENIRVDTLVVRGARGNTKAVFFIPEIHYGPAGTLAGSDFPHMLEDYAARRYKTQLFVLHGAADLSKNPISSSQYHIVRGALDKGVATAKKQQHATYAFESTASNSARITRLWLGGSNIITFTRAPRVTEDIAPDAALVFRSALDVKYGNTNVIVDAHNSRYETASKRELSGVRLNSTYMADYSAAIKKLSIKTATTPTIRAGFGKEELYLTLGGPEDLARGNLNVALFEIKNHRYAMVVFNSNNILPSLRNQIVRHIKNRYGADAEVYTTDTHAVNSVRLKEDNVLGRKVRYNELEPLLDSALDAARGSMERVEVHTSTEYMQNFMVWGPNVGRQLFDAADATFATARIVVPIIIAAGFIIATWAISII